MYKDPRIPLSNGLLWRDLTRYVFSSTLSLCIAVALVCSLLLQPIDRAFAAPDEAVTDEAGSDESPVLMPDVVEDVTKTEIAAESELAAGTDIETSTTAMSEVDVGTDAGVASPAQPEESPPLAPPPVDEATSVPNGDEVEDTIPDITPDISSTSEAIGVFDDDTTADSKSVSGEGDNVPAEDAAAASVGTAATTTAVETLMTDEAIAEVNTEIPTLVVESDEALAFSKDTCVRVTDGSYYCQVPTDTPVVERGFVALPDADGDLEIYLKLGEDLTQLTFNTVDDAAPLYDAVSDSVVWHRNIDDRYQIMVYDLKSAEEMQLTDTRSNNMEPQRSGDYIVWQEWADEAWQIMLYDGSEAMRLTQTAEHNIAPVVRNNLVLWNRISDAGKTIEVYDITSGEFVSIADSEGASVANPRMVLVYDAEMDNGEVVTRGYDIATGEITSFARELPTLPERLPEPDPISETRALIQPKPTTEDDAVEIAPDDESLPPPEVASSSVDQIADLVILPTADSVSMDQEMSATTTSYDLDLRPAVETVANEVVLDPEYDIVVPLLTDEEIAGTTTPTALSTAP